MGDYPVDQHHYAYPHRDLPDGNILTVPSYGLPLATLLPEDDDRLVLAEKAISVSNIVNGSTRLQPVCMQIGQAAGTLAALAARSRRGTHAVSVRQVQAHLLGRGAWLLPLLDVEPSSPRFAPYQRVAATGLLRGEGRHQDWQNQTWLRADTLLLHSELTAFTDFYPHYRPADTSDTPVTLPELVDILRQIAREDGLDPVPLTQEAAREQIARFFPTPPTTLTRGAAAVLIDQWLHPFERHEIDLLGRRPQGTSVVVPTSRKP